MNNLMRLLIEAARQLRTNRGTARTGAACAALLFSASVALSQVAITAADIAGWNAVGSVSVQSADSVTKVIGVGRPGSSSWDFSGLSASRSWPSAAVAADSTPFRAGFPGAEFALRETVSLTQTYASTLGPVTFVGSGPVYSYFVLKSEFLRLGRGGVCSGTAKIPYLGTTISVDATVTATEHLLPADTLCTLPVVYGSRWRSAFRTEVGYTIDPEYPLLIPPMTLDPEDWTCSYVVDAYGPMAMPDGRLHDALRIRKVDSSATSAFFYYLFLAKDGSRVTARVAGTSFPDSGAIEVAALDWSIGSAITAAESGDERLPNTPMLWQNYPNPFNPMTTIRYALPRKEYVRLSVYNMLGQEVDRLIDRVEEAGYQSVNFDARSLPSGIYAYRLTAGTYTNVKKMVLVK